MKRKIILLGGLFFLISIAFLGSINVAVAAEDSCLLDKDCLVPAPTLVVPENNSSSYASNLVITGLSWNETLVDVYVDGIYNGRAELNIEDSGIGNFAYRTFMPLAPGEHIIYTVARNLNEKERSVESSHIAIYILSAPFEVLEEEITEETAEQVVESEEIIEEMEEIVEQDIENDQQEQEGIVAVSTNIDDPDINIAPEQEGEVNVNEGGQIEGGVWEQDENKVSELQRTVDRDEIINEFFTEDAELVSEQRSLREKQNRQIGLEMLGIIIVISIVWLIFGKRDNPQRVVLTFFEGIKKGFKTEEKIIEAKDKVMVKTETEEKTQDKMDDELDRLV
ncbi:hypothetical protein ISR92_01530 [Patescibacteria group bacterium]|nr:hypothetical protein [Patescibacteria group bacterium]